MAAMAILHGLSPTPVEHCRVLEVGCSEGGNIIPMAYAIPGSEFVGFDSAELPVKRAQDRIRDLGLRNVSIFKRDILEPFDDLGRFDYIIAHGFYAWVPEAVRSRLLELTKELLTPDGIAFVSYNAKPGGYLRTMIRDMLMFSVEGIDDAEQCVSEGLDFLRFVVAAQPENDIYRVLLDNLLKRMEARRPGVTCHDEMGEAFYPVHFIEFARHAAQYGLAYLDEAVLPPPQDAGYKEDVRSVLGKAAGGDFLKEEQLLDFVRMRAFRETLLVHADRKIDREFSPAAFRRLLFASQTTAAPGEKPDSRAFVLPGGARVEANHPAVIALLEETGKAWPSAVGFADLEPTLMEKGFVLETGGAALLIRLVVAKMIELRTWCAPVASRITERPKASACSRQEARLWGTATTLLHSHVKLEDDKVRHLLQLMDGSRDRNGILQAMQVKFPDKTAAELEAGLESSLHVLRQSAFLEA